MNEKNILLQKLHRLNNLHEEAPPKSSEKILFEMESLLMQYLEQYPQDTEVWLMLTMVEFTPPWEDYERIEKYTKSILEYDKNNIQALLILAYAQCIYRGEISDDIFIRLQDCCNIITDKELLSMIYSAIAWYYAPKDNKKYEQALLKSIDCCNKYADSYKLLGQLYLETGKITEGRSMINCALKNIHHVYGENYFSFGVTDINEFFNEFFRGTHITRTNLESLRKLLD